MNSDALNPSSTPESVERGHLRHAASLASVLASGALLVALYRSLDVRLIWGALLRADRFWLVVSVGMILPITVLRAIRFYWAAPAGALPGVAEALRLTLAASAFNVVFPAKTGDLVKSYFVAVRGGTPTGVAIAIVVYERLCDLCGLLSWGLLGWLIGRPQVPGLPSAFWLLPGAIWLICVVLISSERAATVLRTVVGGVFPHGRLRRLHNLADGWPGLLRTLRGRRRRIVSLSLGLWLVSLIQMWMFTVALSVSVPVAIFVSLASLALMAGQLPMTVAGLGTRDLALVLLLSGYMPPESAAALGVLFVTRNLVPPLVGIPMTGRYLSSAVGEARRWRAERARVE